MTCDMYKEYISKLHARHKLRKVSPENSRQVVILHKIPVHYMMLETSHHEQEIINYFEQQRPIMSPAWGN